jgi:hypothetical protein
VRHPALGTLAALAEYQRLVAAGVRDESAARILAVESTRRRGVRGDDERAYWRATRRRRAEPSPAARIAHAAAEAVRITRRSR